MKSLLIGLLAILSATASAQTPGGGDPVDDAYHNYEGSRNKLADVTVQGLTVNQWVSGTKVEFTIHAGVAERPLGPAWKSNPDTNWTRGIVSSVSLKIGGEPVTLPAIPPEEDSYTKTVRFASTHFPDGSDPASNLKIDLELTATFVFQRMQGTTVLESETSDPITIVVSVKAYNKGHLLATREDYNPTFQLDFGQYGFSWNSIQGMDGGRPKILAMNHSATPGAGAEKLQEEPAVGTNLRSSTFAFWFTHGWLYGMEASYSSHADSSGNPLPGTPSGDDGNLIWPEIYDYAYMGRTVPTINMVLAYSCLTTAAYPECTDAFGITLTLWGQPITFDNRAYAGFPKTVWSMGNRVDVPSGYWPLYEHSNRVLLFLSQGNTIEEAVREANLRVQTCDNHQVKLDLECKGDPYARLIYVYMNSAEWDESRRYSWYWVR